MKTQDIHSKTSISVSHLLISKMTKQLQAATSQQNKQLPWACTSFFPLSETTCFSIFMPKCNGPHMATIQKGPLKGLFFLQIRREPTETIFSQVQTFVDDPKHQYCLYRNLHLNRLIVCPFSEGGHIDLIQICVKVMIASVKFNLLMNLCI